MHYFCVNSDFIQGENSRSSIGQRLCIVSFLEALLSENFFVCRVLSSVVVRVLLLLVVDHRGALFILCFLFSFLVVCILDVFGHLAGKEAGCNWRLGVPRP